MPVTLETFRKSVQLLCTAKMSFEGKNIIMTGAGSRGILYEAAKGFLAKGASVSLRANTPKVP